MAVIEWQSVWVGPTCGSEMILVLHEAEVVLFDITVEENINVVSHPSAVMLGDWCLSDVGTRTSLGLLKLETLPDDWLDAELGFISQAVKLLLLLEDTFRERDQWPWARLGSAGVTLDDPSEVSASRLHGFSIAEGNSL